jgi:DNA-binding beta-propeller fold protein YncE
MRFSLILFVFLCSFVCCKSQKPFGTDLLKLQKEIAMPDVKGRIDHMAINLKDKVLYMAALGNNSVEVIDIDKGLVIKSIKGIEEPQGIAYLVAENEIAVASGANGDCVFFNASTFERLATVKLAGDADNIRYDAIEKKLYVGYGNGGLALIDPVQHKVIKEVYLTAHAESFQPDKKNNRLYANLPDSRSIAVIDVKSFTVMNTWHINKYNANFPMTLDTANDLVFVGFRRPAVLLSYDCNTGKQVSTNELIDDVDDIFYNAARQEVIASGGGGAVNIFRREDAASYKRVAVIPTRDGARTSLLIPELGIFVVAARATSGESASLLVYRLQP